MDELPNYEFCKCEFEPDDYLYLRVCPGCSNIWFGLHCRHDGYQNPCPECGVRPAPVSEDIDPEPDPRPVLGALQ